MTRLPLIKPGYMLSSLKYYPLLFRTKNSSFSVSQLSLPYPLEYIFLVFAF